MNPATYDIRGRKFKVSIGDASNNMSPVSVDIVANPVSADEFFGGKATEMTPVQANEFMDRPTLAEVLGPEVDEIMAAPRRQKSKFFNIDRPSQILKEEILANIAAQSGVKIVEGQLKAPAETAEEVIEAAFSQIQRKYSDPEVPIISWPQGSSKNDLVFQQVKSAIDTRVLDTGVYSGVQQVSDLERQIKPLWNKLTRIAVQTGGGEAFYRQADEAIAEFNPELNDFLKSTFQKALQRINPAIVYILQQPEPKKQRG